MPVAFHFSLIWNATGMMESGISSTNLLYIMYISDSSGQVRDIWVRYVRDYPVENNDWGDFQTHRYSKS